MEKCGTKSGLPTEKISIAACDINSHRRDVSGYNLHAVAGPSNSADFTVFIVGNTWLKRKNSPSTQRSVERAPLCLRNLLETLSV
uniref:(California timema) hypothetical protein n=1 Tax=Timema californicum TaxID=61474 RepID=A0A7R9J6S5_TIMCA|nr:unnamed protein product [Timema californicum]